MATLPTLTVTDAQMSRITAAFTNAATGTPVQNYKAWLKEQVKNAVFSFEASQINVQRDADLKTKYDEVQNDLNTAT